MGPLPQQGGAGAPCLPSPVLESPRPSPALQRPQRSLTQAPPPSRAAVGAPPLPPPPQPQPSVEPLSLIPSQAPSSTPLGRTGGLRLRVAGLAAVPLQHVGATQPSARWSGIIPSAAPPPAPTPQRVRMVGEHGAYGGVEVVAARWHEEPGGGAVYTVRVPGIGVLHGVAGTQLQPYPGQLLPTPTQFSMARAAASAAAPSAGGAGLGLAGAAVSSRAAPERGSLAALIPSPRLSVQRAALGSRHSMAADGGGGGGGGGALTTAVSAAAARGRGATSTSSVRAAERALRTLAAEMGVGGLLLQPFNPVSVRWRLSQHKTLARSVCGLRWNCARAQDDALFRFLRRFQLEECYLPLTELGVRQPSDLVACTEADVNALGLGRFERKRMAAVWLLSSTNTHTPPPPPL
jgi:hypothetical protein